MKRNPLDKETFLQGNRQKWLVVALVCGFGVMVAHIIWKIEPIPFMTFLTTTFGLFIFGASADSALKIKAEEKERFTNREEPGLPELD